MFAILALASSAAAANNAITYPISDITVNAGSTLDIKWANASGSTADLILRTGEAKDLKTVSTIASNINNQGAYAWQVPTDLAEGEYTVEIAAGGDENYSSFFKIVGGHAAANASANATTSAAPTTAPNATAIANTTSAETTSSATSAPANVSSAIANTTSSSAVTTSPSSLTTSAAPIFTNGTAPNGTVAGHHTSAHHHNSTASSTGIPATNGTSVPPSGSVSHANGASLNSWSNVAFAGAVGAGAMLLI